MLQQMPLETQIQRSINYLKLKTNSSTPVESHELISPYYHCVTIYFILITVLASIQVRQIDNPSITKTIIFQIVPTIGYFLRQQL